MKFKKNLFILFPLLTGLMLISCEDDELVDPDDAVVEANFSYSPENPAPGQEVVLDAGSSTSDGEGDLSYSWSLSVPEDSDAELDSESGETTSFTADITGDYEVSLEVTSGESSDEETQVITVSNEEELSSDIDEDRTLYADVLYTVTAAIDLNAEVTVEPGTVLRFEEDAGFDVRSGGVLNAEATSEDSIHFTATNEIPGWWRGIRYVGSTALNNVLEYVAIEYAGNGRSAALMLDATIGGDGSETDFRNSVVRYNDANGLYIGRNSELRNSSANSYTGNDMPVDARAYNVHTLSGNSAFTGNNEDVVFTRGHDVEDDDVVWSSLDVPYQLSGQTEVSDVTLEIEAGAVLAFEEEADLSIRSGGTLLADGTGMDNIVFTATQETPGWWSGIRYVGSKGLNSVLNHVVIEYAGNDRNAALLLDATIGGDGSATDFSNSTIRYTDGYGLYLGEDSELRNAAQNTYTGNEMPVDARAYNVHYLDESSAFTGNNEDFVDVRGREVSDEDVTWQALDVPYLMSGETEIENILLTIEEGAAFHFEEEGSFRSASGATVQAIGTDDYPILFTGSQQTAGWWNGIWVRSNSVNNHFEHIVVEYAGNDREGAVQAGAESSIISGADLQMTDSELRDNDSYGVWISDDSDANQDICTENTFDNNTSGDCEFES